jgi:hypothetical protein
MVSAASIAAMIGLKSGFDAFLFFLNDPSAVFNKLSTSTQFVQVFRVLQPESSYREADFLHDRHLNFRGIVHNSFDLIFMVRNKTSFFPTVIFYVFVFSY